MNNEELLQDFIEFLKKQMRYGSSKMPRLDAMTAEYTSDTNTIETITAGLQNLDALNQKGDIVFIDMAKIRQ